ncbi:MAG TPA: ABC transporter permease, partial [Vicinamibacterales bacterium]|nr:ABC transporter permease [Vicinamibacterales bacterium]
MFAQPCPRRFRPTGMRNLLFDARDVMRGLRRDRGFTVTVIATLAVTIGATTAMFSIVHGVLMRPLPYPEAGRMVWLREIWREASRDGRPFEVNERHFEHWRRNAASFSSLAQFLVLPANLASGGPAAQVTVARASDSLFAVLGQGAAIGRALSSGDDREGSPDVVVIADALWKQRFGGRLDVIGSAIVIDGKPFTVIGVLPPAFRLPQRDRLAANIDAVVPLRLSAGWIGDHNNAAVGRLAPGATIETARAELEVLQRQVSGIALAESGQRVTLAASIDPLGDAVIGRARRGLVLLFGAILAVLAMACSNLSNLALIRAVSRAREGAIRSALGAGRGRLAARTLVEHLILAVAGGALGLVVAVAALRLLVYTAPIDLPRIDEVSLDVRVVAFAFAIMAAVALLIAILPIRHATGSDPQAALRSGSSAAGQRPAALRTRTVLTSLQIAIAVMLLAVMALLGTSLFRVLQVDYGFSAESVLAVPIALPAARYDNDRLRVEAHDRALADVAAVPGVRAVSSASMLPMRGEGQINFVVADGTRPPRSEQPSANFRFVAPDYFAALALPITRGRAFGIDERRSLTPAVISASLAERLWPAQDAIGKVFSRGIDGEPGFEVVGIAADARTTSLERTPPMMVYVPYWWRPRLTFSLLVKTAVDPMTMAPAVRRTIEQIDADIAIGEMRTLERAIDGATAARRYQTRLFVLFGAASLLIATLGVYAVTAYSVAKRRREMNIRVALGASTR